MKKYLLLIPITISFLLLLFSCAQKGALEGGIKDTIPPQVRRSKPIENDTGFTGNNIVIKFDEYFQFNKIEQEFYSSPPQFEQPKFKINRKKLIVDFKEQLDDSMTYTLNFGNSIEDFNERNTMRNFKFVFSTGPVLDSLSISGYVQSAFNYSPTENVWVMLYNQNMDSIPYQEIPCYITKTDTSGYFSIANIKQANYKIFALFDINANMIYDSPDEQIAFLDSLYIPYAKMKITIDTLKVDSLIQINIQDTISIDTIRVDSIARNVFITNLPSNLSLRLFKEDNEEQSIIRNTRNYKGECKFIFNKPFINDTVSILPYNFTSDPNLTHFERFSSKDSIIFWTSDSAAYNMDSLTFLVYYFQKDSADNIFPQTDTVSFVGFDEEIDTIPLPIKHNITEPYDLFQPVKLNAACLISEIDTSKIKLFEIVDTIVKNNREQKMKIFRKSKDTLFFCFSRQLIEPIKIFTFNPLDTFNYTFTQINRKDTFTYFTTDSVIINKPDTIMCVISDTSICNSDTLKLNINYDNLYFFDVRQQFSENKLIPITNQKINSYKRPTEDSIIINFEKEVFAKLNIIPINFEPSPNWFDISIQNKKANIYLKDKDVIRLDTITFQINCFDYYNTKNEKQYFTDTVTIIFKRKKQKINQSIRYQEDKMMFVFNTKVVQEPKIELLNFSNNEKWYEHKLSATNDTSSFIILDHRIKKLDTLKIKFSYTSKNKYDSIINYTDTLALTVKKLKPKEETETEETKYELKVGKPLNFTFKQDSILERQYYIDYGFQSDTTYQIEIDSLSFIDIYENYNDTIKVRFKMQKKNFYGKILLSLTNTGEIGLDSLTYTEIINKKQFFDLVQKSDSLLVDSILQNTTLFEANHIIQKLDTLITDSISLLIDSLFLTNLQENLYIKQIVTDSIMETGQIILQLISKEKSKEEGVTEKILKEFIITKDQELIFEHLPPESYYLKIIYDANSNDKWDTGNYLKHIQPEKVIYYKKAIGVQSGFGTEVKWLINE